MKRSRTSDRYSDKKHAKLSVRRKLTFFEKISSPECARIYNFFDKNYPKRIYDLLKQVLDGTDRHNQVSVASIMIENHLTALNKHIDNTEENTTSPEEINNLNKYHKKYEEMSRLINLLMDYKTLNNLIEEDEEDEDADEQHRLKIRHILFWSRCLESLIKNEITAEQHTAYINFISVSLKYFKNPEYSMLSFLHYIHTPDWRETCMDELTDQINLLNLEQSFLLKSKELRDVNNIAFCENLDLKIFDHLSSISGLADILKANGSQVYEEYKDDAAILLRFFSYLNDTNSIKAVITSFEDYEGEEGDEITDSIECYYEDIKEVLPALERILSLLEQSTKDANTKNNFYETMREKQHIIQELKAKLETYKEQLDPASSNMQMICK